MPPLGVLDAATASGLSPSALLPTAQRTLVNFTQIVLSCQEELTETPSADATSCGGGGSGGGGGERRAAASRHLCARSQPAAQAALTSPKSAEKRAEFAVLLTATFQLAQNQVSRGRARSPASPPHRAAPSQPFTVRRKACRPSARRRQVPLAASLLLLSPLRCPHALTRPPCTCRRRSRAGSWRLPRPPRRRRRHNRPPPAARRSGGR